MRGWLVLSLLIGYSCSMAIADSITPVKRAELVGMRDPVQKTFDDQVLNDWRDEANKILTDQALNGRPLIYNDFDYNSDRARIAKKFAAEYKAAGWDVSVTVLSEGACQVLITE